ncbi:M81 family metallopeptidase [Roseomonas alkaliterrae]|uniref:Microcystin degradation protein MlrC n=1 Tax=Neoroseomonas alkaliterrae TaxID=1452450 RepID=A0A840XJE3_9PROT|nr:M81 family metallopeptidase [Neoroseomonas alkaliterrae]MBB5688036.1 microcystin degradation protein MlrC [Neoroseomonas alkaliterrae]MBR0675920.1 M81 family metallopeptidase [Neoroseomonas alkaliterrae]
MRIAVLQFAHETVTFLPFDTTEEDFRCPGSPAAGEALLATDPKGYMGGFVQVAREYEGVELVGIESPLWPRTGTGSGWITNDAFETFLGRQVEQLRALGPFDGAYLALHGAMGVRGVPRPEAEIARRVREALGPQARIAATFDPHGNEDEEFLRHADMAFCVKYFPHYDMHLQGERAARMLVRAIRGDYAPATVTRKLPILSPTVLQWTGAPPWSELVQRALTWEAREPDLFVNVFFGFPWSDVPDAGMTFQVMTNGDPALARRVAEDMARWAWRRRADLLASATVHRIADGVAMAKQAVAEGRGPVVLADHSDRSGYATWVLREVIAQGLSRTLVATIAAPEAIARLTARGARPGDAVEVEVGGRVDPSAGEAVRITGEVLLVAGATSRRAQGTGQSWIAIRFGEGNVVLLSPFLVQIMEPEELWSLGLRAEAFDVIAIKSRVHFRRGFDDSGFAPTILLVEPDQPFLGTVRLEALPYRHLRIADFYPYGGPADPFAAAPARGSDGGTSAGSGA